MSQRLLRNYIRTLLKEYDDGMYVSQNDGMGTWGQSGSSDLYKIFVSPFTDVIKTTMGKTKEVIRRTGTLLHVAFETIVTTINPFVEDSYDEIFQKEEQDIQRIRGQYKDVYDRTAAALGGDATVAAFFLAPGAVMAAEAVKAAPGAAAKTLSVLSGGASDKYFSGEGGGRSGPRGSKIFDSKKFKGHFLNEEKEDDQNERIKKALNDPKVIAAIEKNTSPIVDSIKAAKFEMVDSALELAQGILQAKSVGDVKKILGNAASKADAAVEQKMKSMKDMPPEEAKKFQEMMKSEKLPAGTFEVMKGSFIKPLAQELKNLKKNKASEDVIKKYEDAIAKIKTF